MNAFRYQHVQRGTSIIEFVVVLPLLLLILWGVVIFTTVLHAKMVITRSAEDAARSVSFFSGASTYEDLESSLLAPCTAQDAASVQCEALASLAHSSLFKGTDTTERFALLQPEVSIIMTEGVCSSDNTSLGVEVRVPLELIRILPPLWGFSTWIPNDLTACAVIAL